MGDESESKRANVSKHSSTAAGRAAQRRVKIEGHDRDQVKPARPPKVKLPLYRRGGFWFLVIVAEVLVALFLSFRLEPSADTVDLAGADVPAFCGAVTEIRQSAASTGSIDVTKAVDTFQAEVDAYRRLSPLAPSELRPDLDKLIAGQKQIVQTARAAQEKKKADPSYLLGPSEIASKQFEMSERYKSANQRLTVAVRTACNVDLNTPVTVDPATTTVPASTPGITSVTTSTP